MNMGDMDYVHAYRVGLGIIFGTDIMSRKACCVMSTHYLKAMTSNISYFHPKVQIPIINESVDVSVIFLCQF